jgi:hypothetical protein
MKPLTIALIAAAAVVLYLLFTGSTASQGTTQQSLSTATVIGSADALNLAVISNALGTYQGSTTAVGNPSIAASQQLAAPQPQLVPSAPTYTTTPAQAFFSNLF